MMVMYKMYKRNEVCFASSVLYLYLFSIGEASVGSYGVARTISIPIPLP
jgi:hypothetical protein